MELADTPEEADDHGAQKPGYLEEDSRKFTDEEEPQAQIIEDLFNLNPGDQLEVHTPRHPAYKATVDETMPQMNLVWIRETATGERKMLLAGESHLYRKAAR